MLTFFAVNLLSLPYLKLVGALLLIWIGVKLILPERRTPCRSILRPMTHLLGAVRTIIIADFIMSLDNVLGVAAAANGNVLLLVFGLLISIPLIAWSSQLVLKLIDRFPVIIYSGGGLLGYVAGEMLISDSLLNSALELIPPGVHALFPVACALLVMALGKWLALRSVAAEKVVSLVQGRVSNPTPGASEEDQ